MDEELRAYLVAMEERLVAKMNVQHERLINRLGTLEFEFHNTREFLVNEALTGSRRWRDLESRTSTLEGKE